MLTKTLLALAFLTSSCAFTPAGPLIEKGVRNFDRVDAGVSRGAQPGPAGVATLGEMGVRTIVNLRPRAEAPRAFDAEEAAVVSPMDFRSVPLSNWFAPRENDVVRVLEILNDPARQPVFVHCQRGADRTGTIVAIYRIMHDCQSADAAIREARAHGMAWWQFPMRRFIRAWDRSRRPARCGA